MSYMLVMTAIVTLTEHIAWIEQELAASSAPVRFVVGHLNVYTKGKYAPGYEVLWE